MKIGLTGGIACGKSTVAELLQKHGIPTLATDAVVAEIYQDDAEVREALVSRLGSKIIKADGKIDRTQIAERVIADDNELAWLEALLHPRVGKRWRNWLTEKHSQHAAVEIPLLFEKKLETDFDIILAVIARSERQYAWLAERNLSHDQARRWIDKQWPNSRKAEQADYVISNDGSIEFLQAQVERFLLHLQA